MQPELALSSCYISRKIGKLFRSLFVSTTAATTKMAIEMKMEITTTCRVSSTLVGLNRKHGNRLLLNVVVVVMVVVVAVPDWKWETGSRY